MMFELTERRPPLEVPETEYRRLLGYPPYRQPAGRARELADAAQKWFHENGSPWIFAREIGPLNLEDGRVVLGGTEFSAGRLHGLLSETQAHGAVLVAVSAGKECEEHACELWREDKPDEYFFLEVFGSAVVEHLLALARGRICGWADENQAAVLPHCSPGLAGWNIAEQTLLWNLIRPSASGCLPGELEVLESGMLRPKKSQLAVFGLTREVEKARRYAKLIPCEDCALPICQYRRTTRRSVQPGRPNGPPLPRSS
ncbi:MAG: hypothetical protein ABSH48_16215 [Verrucomicrobiota bacterium]|jgi:hypothetical protein